MTANSSAEAPRGIFFGWRVVLAVSLAGAAAIGVGFSSFIMFSAPFSQEFGWSDAQTGALVSVMWVTGPLVLAIAPLVDRIGPWRLVIVGMALQAAEVAAATLVQNYEQMLALRLLMGASLVLQTAAAPVLIARWFDRRFSIAMAITWSAAAGGQIIMSPLTVFLDEAFGWRTAALLLAGLMVVVLLAAVVISKCASSPAQLGLNPDGLERPVSASHSEEQARASIKETLAAIHWPAAGLMCLAVFMAGTTTVAFQAAAPAFFSGLQMSQSTAAILISTFAATALAGSIAAGWMLDKFRMHITSLTVAVTVYVGLLFLMIITGASNPLLGGVAAGFLGYGLGSGEVLWITLFKRQFGARAFATTYGIFFCSFQLGMAFGGFAGGLAFEKLGLLGFAGALCAAYLAPILISLWRPGKMVSPDASAG